MPVFEGALLAALAVQVVAHRRHFAGVGHSPYRPAAAWSRSGIYITACWLVAAFAGTAGRIIDEAPVRPGQIGDTGWLSWTIGSVLLIIACYWGIWGRWTLHFDRPRHVGMQVLFGILWGSGTGQLLASAFVIWDATGWPRWGVWIAAYCCIAVWQGAFQDLYWDIYVTPEHDTPWSISRKVACSHIPNVTVTLTYLVLYENILIFVALQSLGLVAASVFMRFPVPWETSPIHPASTGAAFAGLLRATGYDSDDPDPYTTQRRTGATT